MILKGKTHKFGDNIDTDVIISAKYLTTINPQELGKHCMEVICPDFPKLIEKGDIIVAGKNFGCGSSREHAPLAIKGCGISCVIAKSFARIFFRNSINIGLPIFELNTDEISQNDLLEIDTVNGTIKNLTQQKNYSITPFPEFMQEIIKSGGLINYIKLKNSIIEKRQFPRVESHIPVEIYDYFSNGLIGIGRLHDISIGGVGLETQSVFTKGQKLNLRIMVKNKTIILPTVVVWIKQTETKRISGLKFYQLEPLSIEIITEFIQEHLNV